MWFSDAYIVVKGDITATKKAFTANDFAYPNNADAIAFTVALHLQIQEY